ncbi:hypothetical protein FF2_040992 [Malus domestica]
MYFDGSSISTSAGVGIVIQSPHQHCWFFSLKLDFDCTNNQAEYEALVIGLSVLHDLHAARVIVFYDSELVINQLNGTFRCMSCTLAPYHGGQLLGRVIRWYHVQSYFPWTEHRPERTRSDSLRSTAPRGKCGPMILVLR